MEKTIKISEKNYLRLLKIAAELQKERGRRISFDDALNNMDVKRKDNKGIMKFAGSWKLSDKEAETLIKDIYKERKIVSRRL